MDTTRAAAQFRYAALSLRGAKAMADIFKAHHAASEAPKLPLAINENQTEG